MKNFFFLTLLLCLSERIIAQREYLYQEDFNDKKEIELYWGTENTDYSTTQIKKCRMLVDVKKEVVWKNLFTFYTNPAKNFDIILSAMCAAGSNSNSYGITFGAKDLDNRYIFMINSEGDWEVFKHVNGKRIDIEDGSAPDIILPKGKDNIIRLAKTPNYLYFLVNGKIIHTMPTQKLMGYYVGFCAEGTSSISFDYFYIKQKQEAINL